MNEAVDCAGHTQRSYLIISANIIFTAIRYHFDDRPVYMAGFFFFKPVKIQSGCFREIRYFRRLELRLLFAAVPGAFCLATFPVVCSVVVRQIIVVSLPQAPLKGLSVRWQPLDFI